MFGHSPLTGLLRRLRLAEPDDAGIKQRALLLVLIGWVPLILLAIVQSAVLRADDVTSLLREPGLYARYLIAVPLMVFAEALCVPRLNAVVRHFIASGIIIERDRARFDSAIASTQRLLRSVVAEIGVVALAYLVVAAVILSHPVDQLPGWAVSRGIMPIYSLVGWWHMLISLPLLLIVTLGWLWRLALWARLLWLASRLDLRLVASHPDRCAGLSFVGHSVRAFWGVVMAFAVIVAGRSASIVLEGGELPTPHLLFNVGLMLATMALFVAPVLAFTPALTRAWQRGSVEYDLLADQVGHTFERRWIGDGRAGDADALEQPDFSATADLYSVVSNVHAIRLVPIDLKDVIVLAVAILLPFVPVVLLAVPMDVIWAEIKGLLL